MRKIMQGRYRGLLSLCVLGLAVVAAFVTWGLGKPLAEERAAQRLSGAPVVPAGLESATMRNASVIVSEIPLMARLLRRERPVVSAPPLTPLEQRAGLVLERLRELGRYEASPWAKMHLVLMFGPLIESPEDLAEPLRKSIFHPRLTSEFWQVKGEHVVPRSSAEMRFACQRHRDQFLAYLAMAGVSLDAQITIDGVDHTLREVALKSLYDVRVEGELEWTVAAYGSYLDPNAGWVNKYGETISLPILAEALLGRKSAPCDGAHRMSGLVIALAAMSDSPTDETAGIRSRIHDELENKIRQLRFGQAAVGSVPGTGDNSATAGDGMFQELKGLYFTGHALEWMSLYLPPDELSSPFLLKAVEYVADASDTELDRIDRGERIGGNLEMSIGILGHAASGLSLWLKKSP